MVMPFEYKPSHTALLSMAHRHAWSSQHKKNHKLHIDEEK